jgi:hypothetical protein
MTLSQQYPVALPPDADPENIDNWETGSDSVTSRLVWSTPMTLAEGVDADVRIVASQRPDGSVIVDDSEGPCIYVDDNDYTVREAREIARALIQAADLADQWAGVPGRSITELLADAFSILRVAHSQLSTRPGNADSYVRAALDSISDAAEVVLR